MNKIKSIIIGIAVVFLAVNTVYAWGDDSSKGRDRKDRTQIFKDLNLTDDQQQKMELNRTEQFKKAQEVSRSVKEEYGKLQEAMKDPSVTKDKVEPIVARIKSLQAEIVDSRVSSIFAAKEILTPEQFAKFNKIIEERKAKRQGHSGHWGKESSQR
jgi:Spy/CpxP family protein refolding chaperone